MPRPGRRGGDADTRGTIIEAARAEFLESGYNEATIRAIARRAEVDPALIYHFFTDKPTLYAATLNLPVDPRRIQNEVRAADAVDGGPRGGGSGGGESQQGAGSPGAQAGMSAGATLVERFLSQWETGPGPP